MRNETKVSAIGRGGPEEAEEGRENEKPGVWGGGDERKRENWKSPTGNFDTSQLSLARDVGEDNGSGSGSEQRAAKRPTRPDRKRKHQESSLSPATIPSEEARYRGTDCSHHARREGSRHMCQAARVAGLPRVQGGPSGPVRDRKTWLSARIPAEDTMTRPVVPVARRSLRLTTYLQYLFSWSWWSEGGACWRRSAR